MDIIKLLLIFVCIITVIKFNKPLYISLAAGVAATIVLFGINPFTALELIVIGAFRKTPFILYWLFIQLHFCRGCWKKGAIY